MDVVLSVQGAATNLKRVIPCNILNFYALMDVIVSVQGVHTDLKG